MDLRPIVISGPSGVGKGTLIQMLLDAHPGVFTKTVSHTTRPPRSGEVEGDDYFFISQHEFTALLARDALAEHTFFSGNYYGTSKQTITDQTAKGLVVLLEIDVEGARQMRERSVVDARYIFIKPPNSDRLEAWLRERGTESQASIERRLLRARAELEQAETPGLYDIIVLNEDLSSSCRELEAFIFGPAM